MHALPCIVGIALVGIFNATASTNLGLPFVFSAASSLASCLRAAGDANAEHDIYHGNAICDYPQSGERILGRTNSQALRSHHPGKPSGFNVKRILGKGDLWITEYTIIYQGRPAYTVSIMEFRIGKVEHETQYFADPFEAPAWRSQRIQQIA